MPRDCGCWDAFLRPVSAEEMKRSRESAENFWAGMRQAWLWRDEDYSI